MQHKNKPTNIKLKVSHDFQRQILEITSLIRVINYFYFKRARIDYKNAKGDSLKNYPSDYKDSYKFPGSIILFEQWMNLGLDALYPRLALHYLFPGFLKGEKKRNLFQFTFSTSRGFGFPIYFGPEFYGYILKYGKVLEPLFKWSHTVCHRANQAIFLFDNLFNVSRHHLGEYESAIISEYKNGIFKGISTLLHGYFTRDPKTLGIYSSLDKALERLAFSYSVGDHAIKVETKMPTRIKYIPLICNQEIKETYNIDFYSYTLQLFSFQKLLIKKILKSKKQKKDIISKLRWIEKIKFRINQSTYFSLKSVETSESFINIDRCIKSIKLMEKLIDLIFITPLQSHTYHSITPFEFNSLDFKNYNPQEEIDSIFLIFIKYEENEKNFQFNESEVIQQIETLSNLMGKMWIKFRDNNINNALEELNKLSRKLDYDASFKKNAIEYIKKLIPIFSIYEIFHRALSETIYPEATPERKRIGSFIARFLGSRYNLFGVNLMRHFNNLAFNNWAYFIKKKRLSIDHFFEFIIKLPIWKYIPIHIKKRMISNLNL